MRWKRNSFMAIRQYKRLRLPETPVTGHDGPFPLNCLSSLASEKKYIFSACQACKPSSRVSLTCLGWAICAGKFSSPVLVM